MRRRRAADVIMVAVLAMLGSSLVFADEVTGALYRYLSTGQTRASLIPPFRLTTGSATKSSTDTVTYTRTGTLRNSLTQLTYTGTVTDTQQSISIAIGDFDTSALIPWSEITSTASSTSTAGNATTAHHGWLPKLSGDVAKFIRADGQEAVPTLAVPTSDVCQYYYAVGSSLLGLTGSGKGLCDQFIYPNQSTPSGSTSVTGTGAAVALTAGGKVTFTTGTSSSGAYAQLRQGYNNLIFSGRPDQRKWYIASKMAVTSSISATSQHIMVLADEAGGYTLSVGVRGAVSTTHWSGIAGTSTCTQSSIATDTNTHVFEAYQPTTNNATVYFRVDGADLCSVAIDNASSWTAADFRHVVAMGTTTGTARTMTAYWYRVVLDDL